ncbi:hypothetical protein FA15DRAFT_367027 [Coprinopsis marcescibilis]|uniref:E3 ubiquitin protein ligase n=1 Tax=Coprinopsis marcescibilis TaxID=230819 RepID=A0A5C3LA85_COPMA|nr:hypothetical protein FA15DRAFT_367027 [Coprinopsis marcescibilis]
MESRKRPHTDDGDVSVSKKRVLTGSNGTPHVNGPSDQTEDELTFSANLENFRKEAIFRRMRHYSRENERNLLRIQDLERRKTTCEAGVAAISACWTQLVETIRLLMKTDDIPSSSGLSTEDLFDISSRIEEENIPQLKAALGEVTNATEALVTKFVQLGGEQRGDIFRNEAFVERQKAQTERAALKSELQVTRKQLQDCIDDRDKYHSELLNAQNRLERSKSQTVRSLESRHPPEKLSVNGETEDAQGKPSSPSETSDRQSVPPQHSTPRHIAVAPIEAIQLREQRIRELEIKNSDLQKRVSDLDFQISTHQATIEQNAIYRSMQEKFTAIQHDIHRLSAENRQLLDDNERLRTARREWEEQLLDGYNQGLQEMKTQLGKRDADIARLREQRDQLNADLTERKHKESVKMNSYNEYKNLVESRGERISILISELSRCKARLAAKEGQGDLLLFFLNGDEDAAKYAETLKAQKEEVEVRMEALQHALSTYDQENPDIGKHIKAQAEAEEKLAKVSAELAKYQRVFGDSSGPKVEDTTELERLRLLQSEHEKTEASLYEELEKLSSAWENLDKQLNSKVYKLGELEDKLAHAKAEKAKADNKFWAVQREREAIEAERKAIKNAMEKQGKALDHYAELDKTLRQRVAALELELKTSRLQAMEWADDNSRLKEQTKHWKMEFETRKEHAAHVEKRCRGKEDDYYKREKELRTREASWTQEKNRLQEEIQRIREESDARAVKKQGVSSKEDKSFQDLRSLLLCSVCKTNFRKVIITKCMHTFCKNCMDERIASRQRKCPACSLQFSQSEVHQFYMQ